MVRYAGVIEQLCFREVIAYPSLAFDGDKYEHDLDTYKLTAKEFTRVIESLYANDYIIVDMNEIWTEERNPAGEYRMVKAALMVPKDKKPIVLSFDDMNFYDSERENGVMSKLIIGRDGEIWSYGKNPDGEDVISQELEAISILDKFCREHPDFSLNGARGCISLTGYHGVLGYRTNTSDTDLSPEFEAARQKELEAVRPVIAKLRAEGWYFACHTYSRLSLAKAKVEEVSADLDRWMREVAPLTGATKIVTYPFGNRLDGNDVRKTGDSMLYYQSQGFRLFCSLGVEAFTTLKTTISAVTIDRMHSEGATLRNDTKGRYAKFYDARLIWDDARPLGTRGFKRTWE
jgi:hypothetical protein